MRISDWSSDVCSSDLKAGARFSPTWDQPSDADDGAPAACILLAAYAASAMKRATSCGAICNRAAAWRLSSPAKRRSSLKSPRLGDTTTASIPASSEEHTSELQSLTRISYAVFCLKQISLPLL